MRERRSALCALIEAEEDIKKLIGVLLDVTNYYLPMLEDIHTLKIEDITIWKDGGHVTIKVGGKRLSSKSFEGVMFILKNFNAIAPVVKEILERVRARVDASLELIRKLADELAPYLVEKALSG